MSEEAAAEDRAVSDATRRWTRQMSSPCAKKYHGELRKSYLSRKMPNKILNAIDKSGFW